MSTFILVLREDVLVTDRMMALRVPACARQGLSDWRHRRVLPDELHDWSFCARGYSEGHGRTMVPSTIVSPVARF